MHVLRATIILAFLALNVSNWSIIDGSVCHAEENQLVAEVNDSKIFMSDLNTLVRKELGSNFDSFNKAEQHLLLKTSMDKLIERKILLSEAEKLKLMPTTQQVDIFIASIDSQLGETSSVKKELEKHGAEEIEFKTRLREELAIKQYLDTKVFSNLEVSAAEIEAELKNSADRYKATKQVCARYVEFKIPTPDKVKEVQEKAASALSLVRENQDFSDIARKFSEASNKAKGGDLGCFTVNQLPEELTKVAFALNEGQVSDLVQSKSSFFFVKVEKIKAPVDPTKEELKIKAEQAILRAKREKSLNSMLDKLKAKSKIIRYFH